MPRKPIEKPEPEPATSHHVWAPRNSSWLQDGDGGHYPPGSVIPAEIAEDPDLGADARSNIRRVPGEAEPSTPFERPWAQ